MKKVRPSLGGGKRFGKHAGRLPLFQQGVLPDLLDEPSMSTGGSGAYRARSVSAIRDALIRRCSHY